MLYPGTWNEFEDGEDSFLFYNPDQWTGNFRISAYKGAEKSYGEASVRQELKCVLEKLPATFRGQGFWLRYHPVCHLDNVRAVLYPDIPQPFRDELRSRFWLHVGCQIIIHVGSSAVYVRISPAHTIIRNTFVMIVHVSQCGLAEFCYMRHY